MEKLASCTVGIFCEDNCHKETYCRNAGLLKLSTLTENEKDLLFARIIGLQGTVSSSDATLCYHHKKVYLDKYEFRQKSCADPFSVHTTAVKGSLRTVSLGLAKAISSNNRCQQEIKPGQKLCPRCFTSASAASCLAVSESSDTESISEYEVETEETNINMSLTALGCSPIKPRKVSRRDRVSYGKRKLELTKETLKMKFAHALEVETEDLHTESVQNCTKCSDLDEIIKNMKDTVAKSSKKRKIQILTMVPSSWTIEQTAEEFRVSKHMVKKARQLQKMAGFMAEPECSKGKELSPEVLSTVAKFYENDDISRICPGKKDFVSVKIEGERIHKQKRLLLANLHELYQIFKEKTNRMCKIGISKFCELRPPWCITVGAKGAHAVCVCQIHQNIKLLLSAISEAKLDYKSLMSLVVCDVKSRDCMIHRCQNCPGKAALHNYLLEVAKCLDLEDVDEISFKQWGYTDRTTIFTREESVENFIGILCNQIDDLTVHHYTAAAQAEFLKSSKENLNAETVLILLDFSENYSFVVQDSIQGFYWENRQVTLHPVAIYHKSNEVLQCISMCVISDCMQHDTVCVYAFQKAFIKHLKEVLPNITHIKYFSDGAAAQYKNYKNFTNLCMHQEDFGLSAEWHFFATSHGKSMCDGIGGTVKRLATRYSLQHTTSQHILAPDDLFNWANKAIMNIKFLFVSSADVDSARAMLENRFATAKTIPGTRSHHSFIPINKSELKIGRISADDVTATVTVKEKSGISVQVQCGQYVAVVYDWDWYLGTILEVSQENEDVLINFMEPKGPACSFSWPTRRDQCLVPIIHVIMTVDVLTATGRQYYLNKGDTDKIVELYTAFKAEHFT